MKVAFDREEFNAAFQLCASVAPARSPKAVLRNVKLEARESSGVLLGTDLEMSVRVEVPGFRLSAAGEAILPILHFGTILRECPDPELSLETEGSELVVRGSRSVFRLQSIAPDEFPPIPSFDALSYYRFPARLMLEIIRRTAFATDNESTRYALGGVLWEFSQNQVVAVGTDGRRLAKMEGPAEQIGEVASSDGGSIVPTRSMQIMERVLNTLLVKQAEAEVHIQLSPQRMVMRAGGTTVSSNLIEGRFPRWRDVVPDAKKMQSVEMGVGPLHSAVRQAQIATSNDSKGVDFQFGEGTLVLRAQSADVGQTRVELPIAFQGNGLAVTLDPRYIGDFLKVLDPAMTFSFEIKDSETAVVCRTADGYTYVVMPLARERRKQDVSATTA